jgi:hypothetical protein
MVDDDGRVLRDDRESIANLFAGGGAAAGLSGRIGAGGYVSETVFSARSASVGSQGLLRRVKSKAIAQHECPSEF